MSMIIDSSSKGVGFMTNFLLVSNSVSALANLQASEPDCLPRDSSSVKSFWGLENINSANSANLNLEKKVWRYQKSHDCKCLFESNRVKSSQF